jgi:hypothetical protein
MSERHDHGKNFSGKIRIQLFAKSFIPQVYDVLARHTDRFTANACVPKARASSIAQRFVFKHSRKGIALCYAGAWMRFCRRTPARQLFLRAIACPLEHFDAIGFAARRVEDFAVAYALESGAHQADSQHVAGRI